MFATADAFFDKTNKSEVLHHLIETYTDTVIPMIVSILKMEVLWYTYLKI